ncbi:family 28 putative glycosyltransferase [Thermoascus aurantiacus ATCC 26904]
MAHEAPGSAQKGQPKKLCFVTIGATASFDMLVRHVLDESFLKALKEHAYTHLLVQYGEEGRSIFEEFLSTHPPGSEGRYGLEIDGFDYKKMGLGEELRLTKGQLAEGRTEGVVISHAGSGSILEALRVGVPLVVVPNPCLQDNHQQELANELSRQGYVVASQVTDVASAVGKAESLRNRLHAWPPVNSGMRKSKEGLAAVMDDEMGFVD